MREAMCILTARSLGCDGAASFTGHSKLASSLLQLGVIAVNWPDSSTSQMDTSLVGFTFRCSIFIFAFNGDFLLAVSRTMTLVRRD
jgi:hypothetical protein